MGGERKKDSELIHMHKHKQKRMNIIDRSYSRTLAENKGAKER